VRIKIILLVSMLSLVACSPLDIIKSVISPSSGPSLDAELVVGDKKIATEVVGSKETTHNTAETLTQTANIINEANPWFPYLLAMLFLLLPTPSRMWIGIKELWSKR